ncbi:hypothetical protein EYF80_005374 [Liparis tanakae]|uniref:Uncharacterized protein n=1 Tax=Liparis tanakae TaxID=230148 RepID=A0A4Z2J370_9TELE|nr:hypothetical protein EYF80_005374 [Liparis tanakae]
MKSWMMICSSLERHSRSLLMSVTRRFQSIPVSNWNATVRDANELQIPRQPPCQLAVAALQTLTARLNAAVRLPEDLLTLNCFSSSVRPVELGHAVNDDVCSRAPDPCTEEQSIEQHEHNGRLIKGGVNDAAPALTRSVHLAPEPGNTASSVPAVHQDGAHVCCGALDLLERQNMHSSPEQTNPTPARCYQRQTHWASEAACFSSDGLSVSEPWGAVCSVLDFAGGMDGRVGFCVAWGAFVGQTELGKEEMTPPPTPKPASKVLVTTDATVAWLPLEEGPIPVAIETIEKWMPEDVQVEEPELMGAMSAEDAGEIVG